MRKEYDFSKMKARKNPYVKQLKKQVTMRLGTDVIEYFKDMSTETGIPYQNLINMYLRDCAQSHRRLSINWSSQSSDRDRTAPRGATLPHHRTYGSVYGGSADQAGSEPGEPESD